MIQLPHFRPASVFSDVSVCALKVQAMQRFLKITLIVALTATSVVLSSCQEAVQPATENGSAEPAVEDGVKTVDEAVAAGGTAADGSSQVQTAFAAYSWDELEGIAREIEESGSEEAALDVARRYCLVNNDGKLTGDAKPIRLTDGIDLAVQIAGFYHDDKAEGGKAGITFILKDCLPEKHAMNASGNNAGGWAYSDMRLSVDQDLSSLFPSEIADKVVAVNKMTNNVGASESNDVVSVTSDRFWLFSKTELAGQLTDSELVNSTVLLQEGKQYRLFSDCGVVNAENNPILDKRCDGEYAIWWTRSSVLGLVTGCYVTTRTGSTDDFSYYADNEYGVVLGFCI